jgi:hypothetical protein
MRLSLDPVCCRRFCVVGLERGGKGFDGVSLERKKCCDVVQPVGTKAHNKHGLPRTLALAFVVATVGHAGREMHSIHVARHSFFVGLAMMS